jgi:hypothetical protein
MVIVSLVLGVFRRKKDKQKKSSQSSKQKPVAYIKTMSPEE